MLSEHFCEPLDFDPSNSLYLGNCDLIGCFQVMTVVNWFFYVRPEQNHCEKEPPRTTLPAAALESLARCVNGQFGLRYISSRLMMQKNFSISLSLPLSSPSPPARTLLSIALPPHDFGLAASAILSVALGNPTPTPHFTSTRKKDRRKRGRKVRMSRS